MYILSDKIVKIRKTHICCACGRRFEIGTRMRSQVNDSDGLVHWYNCMTCEELLSKFRNNFDDGCGMCEFDCVSNSLERGQTPEDLLRELKPPK